MLNNQYNKPPFLGYGLGLRHDYFNEILEQKPNVDWFEVLSEDFMVPGGRPLHYLHKIREHYPMVMHGVSLSIGSSDPLNKKYLNNLKKLAEDIQPEWISDHLCWTGVDGINMHDLLPLPYIEEAINHVVERISQVQDFLGRQILIENVSSYVTFKQSEMEEWEFLREIAQRADCLILLDINNIYVSGFNHNYDVKQYIDAIPVERVQQFHMAGHQNMGTHIIDTHDNPVIDDVWQLYRYALKRFGAVSAMIERDANMPPFIELLAELQQLRDIAAEELRELAHER